MTQDKPQAISTITSSAMTIAAMRSRWNRDETVLCVVEGVLGRKEVRMRPFSATTPADVTFSLFLRKDGDIYEGDPEIYCQPVDLTSYPLETLVSIAGGLRTLIRS